MNFQSAFRVHLADPLGFEDTPFIVTTAYTTSKGFPCSEWFLVVPEGKGQLYAQRNKLDLIATPDERVKIDEALLLGSSLDQAVLRLRRHIMENKQKLAPLLLAKQTAVQESSRDHLVGLWMRGRYCGCLSEIRAKSECPALIDTMSWLLGLPMLSVSDI
jgi:hypothetical protein